MRRISLEALQEELERKVPAGDYKKLHMYVMEEIGRGRLRPVKASGANGKKPALYREYWLVTEKKDYRDLVEELTYRLVPMISNDYYLKHLDVYEQERAWVLALNRFLRDNRSGLGTPESVNERSFEIWGQEKFLKRGGGMSILKHCGIEPEMLCYYDTTEPMALYTHTREIPQNLLILENKDTFYSMRRHLMERGDSIMGLNVGTLIYGAGKGILRSFQDFDLCAEPYMQHRENRIFYLGDMDYEGIGIYENLAGLFRREHDILPFVTGYQAMLKKAVQKAGEDGILSYLPETKENQNRNISSGFFAHFPDHDARQMKRILEAGRYIPQEILNARDF